MKTVLITGATGYVGAHLTRTYLEQGYRVVACARGQESLDALTREYAQKPLVAYPLDITDAAATNAVFAQYKPDIVVHAAAFPRRKAAEHSDASLAFEQTDLYRLNVEGLKNIARAAAASEQPTHLCIVSSGAAFEQKHAHVNLASPREMTDPFARSKNIGEQEVEKLLAGKKHVGLSILYSPIILDKSQVKGIIPASVDKALAGNAIVNIASPQAGMNFLLADDFCKTVLAVTKQQPLQVERYLINGYRIGTLDLLKKIGSAVRAATGKVIGVEQGEEKVSGMPQADETHIRALLGDEWEWGSIDGTLANIVKNRVAALQQPGRGGMTP